MPPENDVVNPDQDIDEEKDLTVLKGAIKSERKLKRDAESELATLRQEKAQRDEQARKAQEEQAKQQGQWETLAKQREAEANELKPKAEQADRYATRLHARIDAEIKDWPKQAKDLVPDVTTDPDAREAQVEKLRSLVEMLQTRSPGTSPGPRGSGAQTTVGGPSIEDMKNEKRARIGGL